MTTTTTKLSAAARLYREINTNDVYSSVRWIANVLLTGCGKPAKRLAALMAALMAAVDSGCNVSAAQFIMPYECLLVDGQAVVAMPFLDRGEKIAYDKSTWFRY